MNDIFNKNARYSNSTIFFIKKHDIDSTRRNAKNFKRFRKGPTHHSYGFLLFDGIRSSFNIMFFYLSCRRNVLMAPDPDVLREKS